MNARSRAPAVFSIALVFAFATSVRSVHADTGTKLAAAVRWTKVSIDLPSSDLVFPPGSGAEIDNGKCLSYISAGMVLRQPPLTQAQWTTEIDKMRTAYGAPLPSDQIQALAEYLHGINSPEPHTRSSPAGVVGR